MHALVGDSAKVTVYVSLVGHHKFPTNSSLLQAEHQWDFIRGSQRLVCRGKRGRISMQHQNR